MPPREQYRGENEAAIDIDLFRAAPKQNHVFGSGALISIKDKWLRHRVNKIFATKKEGGVDRNPFSRAVRFAARRALLRRVAGAVAAVVMLSAASAPQPSDDLIGIPTLHITTEEDTLLDIARKYDVGYVEIRAANPGIDPWLPGADRTVKVPTQQVLPNAPRRGIVINLAELRLYYFAGGGSEPRSFPIGIGGEGKETPVGRTEIARKAIRPTWIPTKSEHEEDPDLPAVVGPGPDNPMGDYALYLGWKGYAIHGTNKPYSIGRRDSHGCIRMYPEDIATLFKLVRPETSVTVVDQQVKTGWSAGELYLEIHASQADADSLEAAGVPETNSAIDADALVAKAAGSSANRLDWTVIHLAEGHRNGIPVQVTRPENGP